MRWWGWGDPDRVSSLPEPAVALLREEVGMAEDRRGPVALAEVKLPAAGLRPRARRAFLTSG